MRAEPLSRQLEDQRWEKTTLLVKVQWKGIPDFFGMRLRPR